MPDRLTELLAPTVTGLGYELLGIERARHGESSLLRLYIDHVDGITVDDCERVSRQVGDVLEAEQAIRGEYTLEVSSPGIERPLFTLDQHRPYVGEHVRLRLRHLVNGRRRLAGLLRQVDDERLVVELDGEDFAVSFRDVERSQLIADWDQVAGAGSGGRGRA